MWPFNGVHPSTLAVLSSQATSLRSVWLPRTNGSVWQPWTHLSPFTPSKTWKKRVSTTSGSRQKTRSEPEKRPQQKKSAFRHMLVSYLAEKHSKIYWGKPFYHIVPLNLYFISYGTYGVCLKLWIRLKESVMGLLQHLKTLEGPQAPFHWTYSKQLI